MEIFELPGPDFLALYLPALVVAAAMAALMVYVLRPVGARWMPSDPYAVAFLRDGPSGVLQAALAHLAHTNALDLEQLVEPASTRNVKVAALEDNAHPAERETAALAAAGLDVSGGTRRIATVMSSTELELVERGLLISSGARWRNYFLAVSPLLLAALVGIYKTMLGISRDRPVGFLLVASFVGAPLVLIMLVVLRPRLTWAGQKVVRGLQHEHFALRFAGERGSLRHLARQDVLLSVALFGMAPLIGTELGLVRKALTPVGGASDGYSDSGSSCCSSCGGGCGGGCGGCGS